MNQIGAPERATQDRVIKLFTDELSYQYLGDWTDRTINSNIEEEILSAHLKTSGYSDALITKAIAELKKEADHPGRSLIENNKEVYKLLRYGVQVKLEVGQQTQTVHLINWKDPALNVFAIAQEVTLRGNRERRPDLVLYINGIAVGVIELKNSRVSVGEGIRQNLSNQQPEFNEWFFSTVQLVFAGNDTEGLHYGAVGTEEKLFMKWKEDEEDNSRYKLDKYLLKMCDKARLLEFIYDFVLFEPGKKKLPRVHQYFGIKAAQKHVNELKGGIIWHTQGSGKSIVMILLAKWILENKPNARVLVLTDRIELDKQIQDFFLLAGEKILRTSSGAGLMASLAKPTDRLLCSLVHKFGRQGVDDFDSFIADLEQNPVNVVGDLFVLVDECHRTQSGKLHRTMKAMLPNSVFIGFTGTPLLKADVKQSKQVFGDYIHTYKFSEGVEDGVVLDLVYEARDIPQALVEGEKVDEWFNAKTAALNEWQKAALREQWATMQKVLSSKSRMEMVVKDIIFDFATKQRLSSTRGNAILVASSILEACKYFELFQKTVFKNKCAVVTSYNPNAQDVVLEEVGANTETDKQFIFNTYTDLLKTVESQPNKTKTEVYEDNSKQLFVKQPADMKLLIVVDKLLTGFDAPSCTYMYIDKSMQDHGLFQAICRVNRLDGDDKMYGFIVDYKDLFKKVENAVAVYSSEVDDSEVGNEPMLQDRLKIARERLDGALEALSLLCEPVQPPKSELNYIHYFCGNTEIEGDLKATEPQRVSLYVSVVGLVRAYANIADDLVAAGYTAGEVKKLKSDVERYVALRETIRRASGETIDLKAYEADMRHLIDTYIVASQPRVVSEFDDMPLIDLIIKSGVADAINSLPKGIKGDKAAVAETIANNIRSTIIKDHLNDPAFFEKMSAVLKEIIDALKSKRDDYEKYLKRIADLAKLIRAGGDVDLPKAIATPGLRAIFNNLAVDVDVVERERLAIAIDAVVKRVRPDDWRGNLVKERVIQKALFDVLSDEKEVENLFMVIKHQVEY